MLQPLQNGEKTLSIWIRINKIYSIFHYFRQILPKSNFFDVSLQRILVVQSTNLQYIITQNKNSNMKIKNIFRRMLGNKHGALKGDIAIIGSGSWATALAKIIMESGNDIWWYVRNPKTINDFQQRHHNPRYLTSVTFDTDRINFSNDINAVVRQCGILVLVTPSPYLKDLLLSIREPLTDKFCVIATKGIVPNENVVWSEYLRNNMGVADDNVCVLSGPSHAEEVAFNRLTYLTVACTDVQKAKSMAEIVYCDYVRPVLSRDVDGVEYAGVLKNVYALCSGICSGLKNGDNFQAVLIANAAFEMKQVLTAINPIRRKVYDSVYLGDLLVTAYSQFSRNRLFGTMIGRGYSVKAAQMEMSMIAEGYYGANCMHEICRRNGINAPILEAVYNILYNDADVTSTIAGLTKVLR